MSFATDQVALLETLLAENVGLKSVKLRGREIVYDDLLKQYEFWTAKVAREDGTRPRAMQINLSGF